MKIDFYTNSHNNPSSPTVNKMSETLEKVKDVDLNQKSIDKMLYEEKQKKELTKEEAQQIVNGMNEFLKPKFTSLQFKLHEELERYYVEVIDRDTKEVIREIPEKELLDMYAKMTEFIGLFFDKKL